MLCVVAAVTWTACSGGDNGSNATPTTRSAGALDGAKLYARNCASCHQGDGSGIDGVFPALANNPFVTLDDPTAAIATILNGRGGMPRWGDELSDAQVAAILSYVRTSLGDNNADKVTSEKVSEVRKKQGTHPADH